MELKDDGNCYVCGEKNRAGLMLRFLVDAPGRSIKTEFVPTRIYQGFKDVVHGGVISTVLDEAMTKLAFSLGMDAVTGRLTVRFKKPLMVGERIVVTGRLVKETGRAIEASAVAVKDDGVVVAEAEALLVRLSRG
jgi:acyl-coenzyme A thioesterase PaaI-like protein